MIHLGCHQIREIWEFKESQSILFSIRDNQGKERFFKNPKKIKVMKLCNVTFQSDDFLDTPEHIQLSVTITEFYLFQYHCALCSPFEVQLFIL